MWYDIYVAFCKKRKRYKIFCAGEERQKVGEGEIFDNKNTNLYTEDYSCNYNFSNLFNCYKCSYQGKSFKEFLDINQIEENPVDIVNTQNNDTNAGININEFQ